MSVTKYQLDGYRSAADGKFYGKVSYESTVIDTVGEGEDTGFKSERQMEDWARHSAAQHKASISGPDTHKITKTFSL